MVRFARPFGNSASHGKIFKRRERATEPNTALDLGHNGLCDSVAGRRPRPLNIGPLFPCTPPTVFLNGHYFARALAMLRSRRIISHMAGQSFAPREISLNRNIFSHRHGSTRPGGLFGVQQRIGLCRRHYLLPKRADLLQSQQLRRFRPPGASRAMLTGRSRE